MRFREKWSLHGFMIYAIESSLSRLISDQCCFYNEDHSLPHLIRLTYFLHNADESLRDFQIDNSVHNYSNSLSFADA